MHRAYLRPAARAIGAILACFAMGVGFALWLDPSPLVVLVVLTIVWGGVLCSIWGLPWLARLQQRRWLAYWHRSHVSDAICTFYCVPDHCALLQGRCARFGAAAGGTHSMTRSKHCVLQAGLHFGQTIGPLTGDEVLALVVDPAFHEAEAAMNAACLEDDFLATIRACRLWCERGLAVIQRERTAA